MTKNIVIAVDTDRRASDALAVGRLLADTTGARAGVVTVSAQASVNNATDLHGADIEVIAGTSAARELQHVSEHPDTGLLVVGSTTRGPIGRLLIGGVGDRLLAGSAAPVAIAPHGYADAVPSRLARIGVGVDGSDEAQLALDAAVALAAKTGAELRVITAYQPLAFGAVPAGALPGASANDVMRDELRSVHDQALATARESVATIGLFRDGSAESVLLDDSAKLDLLVVGSRGYGPIGAVLRGSTSTALARGAASPILVIPRGTRFGLLD